MSSMSTYTDSSREDKHYTAKESTLIAMKEM